jgi:hypothetical protein
VTTDAEIIAVQGATLEIPFSQVLSNDFDVDGDSLTIADYSGVSAYGGRVTANGSNFTYRPPAMAIQDDLFAYLVSDGRGGETVGIVTLNFIEKNRLQIDPSDLAHTGAKLTMGGTPGQNYQIQASTDLKNWTLLNTVPANSMGLIEIIDSGATNMPARFYRAVAQ